MNDKGLSALAIAVLAMTGTPAAAEILHVEKSLYRNIVVYEDDGVRCMRFSRNATARQTCISLTDDRYLVFNYMRAMMGALYVNPSPNRILIIGLGGGAIAGALQKMLPAAKIDAVEIDPAVVRVARSHFGFVPTSQTNVYEEDGRIFAKRMLKQGVKYDLVILDAFDHQYIPEHLLTREFLQEVRGLLTDRGVVTSNTYASTRLYDHESATYYSVFGDFYALVTNNRVILASIGGLPGAEELRRNAEMMEPKLRVVGSGKDWLLPLFKVESGWPTNTRILTDQYSPSNLLNGM
jgi:spermidine synthase